MGVLRAPQVSGKAKLSQRSNADIPALPLRYLQNCRSVIVTHPLEWIQHYHHLFDASSSSSQNIVVVPTPLTEHLPRVMEHLLADPERAERIASESWRVFREGYLSPAAT